MYFKKSILVETQKLRTILIIHRYNESCILSTPFGVQYKFIDSFCPFTATQCFQCFPLIHELLLQEHYYRLVSWLTFCKIIKVLRMNENENSSHPFLDTELTEVIIAQTSQAVEFTVCHCCDEV